MGSSRQGQSRTRFDTPRYDGYRGRSQANSIGLSYANHDHDSSLRTGLHIGDGSLTAYYHRRGFDGHHGGHHDDHHGHRGHHNRHGLGFGRHDYHTGVSHYGHYYGGLYYPYGYASVFDSYFHRYPYRYVSAGYSPLWEVDPYPDTVYVESPTTVYVDSAENRTGGYPDVAPQSVGPTRPIEIAPQDRIPVNNSFLADGVEAFRKGDYKAARKLFSYSVLDAPQNGFGELSYALALFAEGQYTASAGAIRRGISLVPDVIDRPVDAARMYGDQDSLESHIQQLRLHVAAEPSDADAWLVLGYVLYSSGDPEGAVRAFDRSAQIDSANPVSAIMRDAARIVVDSGNEPVADE